MEKKPSRPGAAGLAVMAASTRIDCGPPTRFSNKHFPEVRLHSRDYLTVIVPAFETLPAIVIEIG